MKLIEDWKKSYKFYSMWIALVIMAVSLADIFLGLVTSYEVPKWVFYLTGPGVAVARVVHQFMDD